MPNWCYNSITISGDKENISMITEIIADTNRKNANERTGGHFKNLVGIPRNMSAEAYEKDWYDTNISYWGTKWDVDEFNHDIEEDCIHLSFDTAWSPPTGFCGLLSKIYNVDVEIFYYEGGCDFCGKAIFKDGEMEVDDCYKYREGMYILDTDIFWSELENDIECGIQSALEETDLEESDLSVPDNMKRMLAYITEETDNQFGDFVSAEDKATIIKMYAEELESICQTQTK